MAITPENDDTINVDKIQEKEAGKGVTAQSGINILKTVSGTNTILATLSTTIDDYETGATFNLTPANNNTAAVTIDIDGEGVKAIILLDGSALVGGELLTTGNYQLYYNGTAFVVLNPSAPNAQTWTPTITPENGILSGTVIGGAEYRVKGKTVTFNLRFDTQLGGAAADFMTFSLPLNTDHISVSRVYAFNAMVFNDTDDFLVGACQSSSTVGNAVVWRASKAVFLTSTLTKVIVNGSYETP